MGTQTRAEVLWGTVRGCVALCHGSVSVCALKVGSPHRIMSWSEPVSGSGFQMLLV